MRKNPASLLLLCLLTLPAVAQEAATTDAVRRAAEQAWKAGDYAAAVEPLTELTEAVPEEAEGWYRLGYSLHVLGRLEHALPAHLEARRLATAEQAGIRAKATYNVACVHALTGKTELAIDWLEKAVEAGFLNTDYMQYDSDLAALQEEERFVALVERVESARKQVAIVVHEGVEMLDFSGPAEVFSAARAPGGGRHYRVFLVAPGPGPVRCQNIAGRILPEYSIADCPKPDVVVVPGGATQVLWRDAEFMEWIGSVAEEADVTMSVCTGAFVLARAGLLDGRKATTHHSALHALRRDYPEIDVLEGVRYCDSGSVITAGGVAAGIDAALRVVENQWGKASAAETARYMEHPWPR